MAHPCMCALAGHGHRETTEGLECPEDAAFVVQRVPAWEEDPGIADHIFLCARCAPDAIQARIGPLNEPEK